ncbi:MAG: hypothetical protein ACK5TP_12055 [bacterium]
MTNDSIHDRLQRSRDSYVRSHQGIEKYPSQPGTWYLLALAARGIGVDEWIAHHDVSVTRGFFAESWESMCEMFERFPALSDSNGDSSLWGETGYKQLLYGLASARDDLPRRLSEHFATDKTVTIMKSSGNSFWPRFSRGMSFTLRDLVLGRDPSEGLSLLDSAVASKPEHGFMSFVPALHAVHARDAGAFHSACEEIIKAHARLARGKGPYALDPERDLSVWGIGIAILAQRRGMPFNFDHPLMPKELTTL